MKTIKIKGMKCGHCEAAVKNSLNGIAGLADIQVNLANNTASYNETSPVTDAVIKAAIKKIGFEVES